MKKAFTFSIMIFLIILVNSTFVSATKPLPSPVANKTTFSGIIPLTENNLEITSNKYKINLLNSNLPVIMNIERQAKVTMSYEIHNPSNSQNVNFTLPSLSRFLYMPNEFEVRVNDKLIDSKLIFSDYSNMDDYFSDYLIKFQKEEYDNFIIRNYEFENDLDGYLYTLVNPKTKSEKFKSQTKIIFYNVPSNTKFIDGQSVSLTDEKSDVTTGERTYDSEQVGYFFVSEDLETDCITTEVEVYDGLLIGYDKLLEPAKIYKEPIKLSDYINRFKIKEYDLAYASEFENYFYKTIDKKFNDSSWIYLSYPYEIAINEYQIFGLEFNVDFEAFNKTTIEITYEIPVFCKYANRYTESHITLDFVNNPGKLWKSITQTEVIIIADEEFIESSLMYEHNGNEYKLLLNNNSEVDSITLTNSLYLRKGCFGGCRFFSVSNISYIGLIFIALFFIRKNKKI